MNVWNCSLRKVGPLSVTILCGIPWVAKIVRSFWIVFSAVMECITSTVSHLEYASTSIKYMWPKNGPAKSRCNRLQGWAGHSHGWIGALGGEGLTVWQFEQHFANCSMSLSRLGHQTYARANIFILLIPVWESCNSSSTCALPSGGMITRDPHSTHPSSTLNSVFLVAYGLNSGPRLTWDQPCKHNFRTQDRTGSASVHFLM